MKKQSEDIGRLILRLTVGILMFLHGLHGVRNGIEFIQKTVVAAGLPEFVSYGIYIGEFVAPMALILGLCTRISAAIVLVNMLFAFVLVHSKELFALNDYGALVLELNYFYTFVSLALIFLGGGNLVVCPRSLRRY